MPVSYPPLFERSTVTTEVDGRQVTRKVVKDEVYASGLSKHVGHLIPVHGVRVLTLDDGDVVYGCRDCEKAGTLGEVRMHRTAEHGASAGARPRKSAAEAAAAGATSGPVTIPQGALSMTVHELLDLAGHIDMWESVLAGMEERLAAVTADCNEAQRAQRASERELAAMKRKMARAMGLTIVTTPEGGDN